MQRLLPALLLATTSFAPMAIIAPAHAASFDCAKASSFFEKAICADPGLSERDETLAVAYATAQGGLSEDALAIMRDGQRQWLDMVQRACTQDAEPAKADYDKDGLVCLTNLYTNRIDLLENSRMIDGLRVYNADIFAVGPDPEGAEYARVSTKALSAPRIDGTSELAAAFNTAIAEDTAEAAARYAGDPKGEDFDAASDEDLRYRVTQANGQVISVEVTASWYGHGAAHGNYAITYLHFLRDKLRTLEPSDVFKGEGWQQTFADLVFAQLKTDLGEDLQAESAADILTAVSSPNRWTFSGDGIGVTFAPYEVAAYAAGARTAYVSWEALIDLLTTDATGLGWQ